MKKAWALIPALASGWLSGCGNVALPTEGPSSSSSALVADNGVNLNGVNLNGVNLNGVNLNGVNLNGVNLNGVNLNGVNLNGVNLNGVNLNGTTLQGVTADGHTLSGSDLAGATLQGALTDGTPVTLHIDAVSANSDPANADVLLYGVSILDSHGAWQPICTDSNHNASWATALSGTWDYRQGVAGGGSHSDDGQHFTFACVGSVIEKCLTFGYKPWLSEGGVSLAGHHQACTRMLRADYCGDGEPNTVDGTPIDLYDGLGIQDDTASWEFEAEWNTDGARCLEQPRKRSAHSIRCAVPHAFALDDCGAKRHFRSGTLLMTESQGPGRHEGGHHH